MDWTPLNAENVAPPPGGWFSHAAKVELAGSSSLMFVSGQAALDDEGNVVGEGDMSAQTEQVFSTLERILGDQGATFDDVVNIRTFVTDMSRISDYGAVRARYLAGPPPTSTTVQVARLVNPGALVEIDIVAVIGNHSESNRAQARTAS